MTALLPRFVPLLIATLTAGCMVDGTVRPTATPSQVDVAALWESPDNITSRDLFYGAGGERRAPRDGSTFTFVQEDAGGYSPGYDVRGADGLEWSAKLGPEAQTEVVVSRILWALGYHQPPTYYVSKWTMTGEMAGEQQPARFRPRLPDWKLEGDWDWYENDFVGTQPFKGLIVANVLLNNWDWKASNNKIYAIGGADGVPARRIFVVQDLGASLGKTAYPRLLAWLPTQYFKQGSRNNLEDFEAQGFIKRVEGDRVEFDYRGIHPSLLEVVTPEDVVWTTRLMSRLTDEQWRDAFRAAGFPQDQAARYIARIKSKIAEGLQLAGN
jgi:hypothetical protein